MKALDVFAPVEADAQVAPCRGDDHVDFVFARAVEEPIVPIRELLDAVERFERSCRANRFRPSPAPALRINSSVLGVTVPKASSRFKPRVTRK